MTPGNSGAGGWAPRDLPLPVPSLSAVALAGHLVVHDRSVHQTHVLDPATAVVWSLVDGESTVDHIVRQAEATTDATGLYDAVVQRLDLLAERHLVQSSTDSRIEPLEATPPGPPPPLPPDSVDAVRTGPRRAGGAVVDLSTNHARVAAHLATVAAELPEAPAGSAAHLISVENPHDGPANAPAWQIRLDGIVRQGAETAAEAVSRARTLLNEVAIDHTTGRLLLHGGAAARGDRAVVVVGPSGAGKSTLVAGLLKAGFDYLTDEAVIIDGVTSRVQPFTKHLDLSTASLELLGLAPDEPGVLHDLATDKTPVAPWALTPGGTEARHEPAPADPVVAVIVLLGDEPDPANTHPREVNDLLDLLTSTFSPTVRVDGALEQMAELVTTRPVLRMHRPSLAEAVAAIERALDPPAHP